MNKGFNKITESLESIENCNDSIDCVNTEITKSENVIVKNSSKEDASKDYEYTRGNLYSLIEKGQEAIDGMIELAQQSESPRAYEVAGQLIKNVGDVTDKLLDLQQKMKKLNEEEASRPKNITNNTMFIGSTADLQKILKNNLSIMDDSK